MAGDVASWLSASVAIVAVLALAAGFVAGLVQTCRAARAAAGWRRASPRRRGRPLTLRSQRRGRNVTWRITYLALLLVALAGLGTSGASAALVDGCAYLNNNYSNVVISGDYGAYTATLVNKQFNPGETITVTLLSGTMMDASIEANEVSGVDQFQTYASGNSFSLGLTGTVGPSPTLLMIHIQASRGGGSYAISCTGGPAAATTATIASSANPAEAGKPVTFTATVTSSGASPTGSVSFIDGGTTLGTGTLSAGVATFVTSSLVTGSHSIVASYAGANGFAASASAALIQVIGLPGDSLRLQQMQLAATRVVAQSSGSAITGAVDGAISDGFNDGGNPVTSNGSGLRFNFAAEPDERQPTTGEPAGQGGSSGYPGAPSRRPGVDDAFAAIDRNAMATKAPPLLRQPKDWMLWLDVRDSGIDRWVGNGAGTATLYGNQVNALVGLTRKWTSGFLLGVFGGYETFDYRADALQGRLKGDGWTTGAYLGWKLAPALRFDAAAAYSGIGYDGTAGTASGSFGGDRWLLSSGLTGSYQASVFELEPSAKVYAMWEHENAYTDTLGTQQGERDFMTGRASAGIKLIYPWLFSATVTLAPYAGLYGDYYFTQDQAVALPTSGLPLASVPLLDGWSARATAGLAARFGNGVQLSAGGELGGIGGVARIWTFRGRASVPF
jgi:hypothetical protein